MAQSKESASNVGDLGLIPDWEDTQEKEMATHSSCMENSATEGPDGL